MSANSHPVGKLGSPLDYILGKNVGKSKDVTEGLEVLLFETVFGKVLIGRDSKISSIRDIFQNGSAGGLISNAVWG